MTLTQNEINRRISDFSDENIIILHKIEKEHETSLNRINAEITMNLETQKRKLNQTLLETGYEPLGENNGQK